MNLNRFCQCFPMVHLLKPCFSAQSTYAWTVYGATNIINCRSFCYMQSILLLQKLNGLITEYEDTQYFLTFF